MRLKSWKVPALILVILSVVILSVPYVVVPARGSQLYEGDWCSFEVPDGCTVSSEDNDMITLDKDISDYEWMTLSVHRFRDVIKPSDDVDDLDYKLRQHLEKFISRFEKILQGERLIGDRIYSVYESPEIKIKDGSHGRTAYDIREYENPDGEIMCYTWAEGDDIVRITLYRIDLFSYWMGPPDSSFDPEGTINDAYESFVYYD